MVDIYADRGITGTSVEKREDFQRLMTDCRRGLIDKILCKSISRFARNTTECLAAIRELKVLGIGIEFEEQHINTAKLSGEMLTAIFASMAQTESKSISDNMRWSYQRRMERGEFNTCKHPFGYRLVRGKLEIFEPEAEIVREIFRQFLCGQSCDEIAEYVTTLGIPTRDGKSRWRRSAISYILRNERYMGNALLQKRYSTDTLPYEKKWNHGERPQYLAEGINSAIVAPEIFQAANELIQRRQLYAPTTNRGSEALSRRLRCGCCGSLFRRKFCREKHYWACLTHDANRASCPITQVAETEIHAAFLRLYYKLKHQDSGILPQMLTTLRTVRNQRMLWSEDIIELNKRISTITSQNQLLAMLKQQGGVDPDIFISRSNELAEQLRAAKLEKERLLNACRDDTITQTQALIDTIEAGPDFLEQFDGELFGELVDRIIVENNERLRFRLKNGLELTESIERTVR